MLRQCNIAHGFVTVLASRVVLSGLLDGCRTWLITSLNLGTKMCILQKIAVDWTQTFLISDWVQALESCELPHCSAASIQHQRAPGTLKWSTSQRKDDAWMNLLRLASLKIQWYREEWESLSAIKGARCLGLQEWALSGRGTVINGAFFPVSSNAGRPGRWGWPVAGWGQHHPAATKLSCLDLSVGD